MAGRLHLLTPPTLFLASVGALALPVQASGPTLLALALGWWGIARKRRERLLVAAAFLAAALFQLGAWLPPSGAAATDRWLEQARSRYTQLWQELDALAEDGASRLVGQSDAQVAAVFSMLEETVRRGASPRMGLLLLDRDDRAMAWAGEGFLHEPDRLPSPERGRFASSGFTATTLFVQRRLEGPGAARSLVAGRSFSHRELPIELPLPDGHPGYRWAVGEEAAGDLVRLAVPDTPDLILEPRQARHPGPGADLRIGPDSPLSALAWIAVGLGLVALATLRLVSAVVLRHTVARDRTRGSEIALLLGGGTALVAVGLGVSPLVGASLAAAAVLAGAGLIWRPPLSASVSFLLGGAGSLALVAAAAALYDRIPGADLGGRLLGSAEEVALRVVFALSALGILCLAAGRRERSLGGSEAWGWLGGAFLLAGGALHDYGVPVLLLLGVGGGSVALWLGAQSSWRRLIVLLPTLLLSSLLGAGAWETLDRHRLRHQIEAELLVQMAPPRAAEMDTLAARLEAFFTSVDTAELVPRSPDDLETRDLAFAVWQGSPLKRHNLLSAVSVETWDGQRSSFSFGIPLRGHAEIDPAPGRWQDLLLPVWEDSLLHGRGEIFSSGAPWAQVEYWLMLRPGFRLSDPGLEEVGIELLKGGAAAIAPGTGLPGPVIFGLYDRHGESLSSPWEEAPPLPDALRASSHARVDTPAGPAWAYGRADSDGVAVLYLPVLGPLAAIERVATHALGVLALLALAGALVLLLALPHTSFRDTLARTMRSYSQRLLLVYSVLLLVPLLLLNIFVFKEMEERLKREQEGAGHTAVNSARRVIGEYVLTLEPGFGVETALDDELLTWLSRVVGHEINLYWGSAIFASSRPELFASGLLTRRIPGEVFARLSLDNLDLASRTHLTHGTEYLELYAPLRIPGIPRREGGFFLSTPLLAQQEEAARELTDIRRQVLLVTAVLFLLLATVGTRLARSFTRPLMDLVEGTKRIAAGSTSVGVSPKVVELAALSEAIDRMAQKIAEGRARLLQEKALAEAMVNNINSGLVSLDREGRVLMRNRVAVELLGAEIGECLADALDSRPGMEGVARFLKAARTEQSNQTTVRVPAGEGGEREWTVLWLPLASPGDPTALVVVEDITDVLRAQRLQAWAEMARMIAHEVKNPLTPIRLSAEHLREVSRTDPSGLDEVFELCIDNILHQVQELHGIASEFSTYSQIPRIHPQPGDLAEAVSSLVEGYRLAPSSGAKIELVTPGRPVRVRFDARLLPRAVRNLLENALRVSGEGDRILVAVEEDGRWARITVRDSGPGVSPALLPRIFEPYFSTHDSGTGLGLPIARRIVEEHGGEMTATNHPDGGLEATISLPLLAEKDA